jgi:hypothetical protein
MEKAPAMLRKRKLALMPPRVKGIKTVRKIIKRVEEIRKR